MTKHASLFHLTDDVASLVLMFCGTTDLLNCRLVCKSWEVHAKTAVKSVVLKTNTTNTYVKNMTLYFCNISFPNLQQVVTVDNIETAYWELPKCKHLKSINYHASLYYGSKSGIYPQEITDLKIAAKFYKRFPKYECFFVRCTIDEAYTIVSKLKKHFIKKVQVCHQQGSIVEPALFFKCFPLLTELYGSSFTNSEAYLIAALQNCPQLKTVCFANRYRVNYRIRMRFEKKDFFFLTEVSPIPADPRFEYLEVFAAQAENHFFGNGLIELVKTKNPDVIIHYNKA